MQTRVTASNDSSNTLASIKYLRKHHLLVPLLTCISHRDIFSKAPLYELPNEIDLGECNGVLG